MKASSACVLSVVLGACAAQPAANDEAGNTTKVSGEGSATDEDGSTTSSSTDTQASTDTETSTDTQTSTTDSESGDGDGDGDGDPGDGDPGDGDGDEACVEPPKLDLPSDSDPAMPDSCTVEPIDWPTPDQYPGCMICQDDGGCWFGAYLGCVEPLPGETCAELCPDGDCIGAAWTSCDGEGPSDGLFEPEDTCGPYEIAGRCCTIGKFFWLCGE